MTPLTDPWLTHLDASWLEAVHEVERRGQQYPWSLPLLMDALTGASASVWGVGVGSATEETLVGFAVLDRLPFDAELQAITVVPEARRQGMAGRLLGQLLVEARGWGSERLLLEVRAGNLAAITLYRRFGFEEDGRRPGYYPAHADSTQGARREDAVLMSRRLDPI